MRIPEPVGALFSAVAGASLVLAFAPFSLGWLAPVSLAFLFHFWARLKDAKQAFVQGWCFGMGLFGFGVFWLHHSIGQFGGLDTPLAILITLLFAAFLALFPAVTGYLVALFHSRPAGRVVLIPAAWVLIEWLRSWLFGGFTWLSLGYSQTDTPLAGYGTLLGVYGISLLVVLSAVLLTQWRKLWIWPVLLSLYLGGWGLLHYTWVTPTGQWVKVAMVQANIPQQRKWLPEEFKPTLKLYTRLSEEQPDAALVVWPETAVTAFAHQVEKGFLQPLHERMLAEGRDLILGIPVRQGDDGYFNAMLSLGLSGRGEYFKRHLVPFGEYMPFSRWLGPLVAWLKIPMSSFSAGEQSKPLIQLVGLPAGVSICYEDTFGNEVLQALPEAAFLINASNDAWFGDSLAPYQHLQMARMRSIETGRYLLRATNTGISAIIDEKGRIQQQLPLFQQGVLSGGFQPMQGSTGFDYWGNRAVVWLCGLLVVLAWGWFRRGGTG